MTSIPLSPCSEREDLIGPNNSWSIVYLWASAQLQDAGPKNTPADDEEPRPLPPRSKHEISDITLSRNPVAVHNPTIYVHELARSIKQLFRIFQ